MANLKFAVVGIINNGGKILVVQKKKYKDSDSLSYKWHIPGGGVEENENFYSAIEREIFEELGIKVKSQGIIDIHVVRISEKDNRNFIVVIWHKCAPLQTSITKINNKELSDAKWVTKSEVASFVDKEAVDLWPPLIKEYFLV